MIHLGGEFAEGVALGVQEEGLSNVAWVHVRTMLQEQGRIGECGDPSC